MRGRSTTAVRAGLVAVMLAVPALLSACSGGSSPAPSSSASSTAQEQDFLHDCTSQIPLTSVGVPASAATHLRIDCGQLQVPLDYAHPDGTQIAIGVVRIRDTRVKPIGQLLVNPGGPGASGVQAALGLTSELTGTLLRHFDLVGFDPRGVGTSAPITCQTNAEKDKDTAASPNVLTASGFASAKAMARTVDQDCAERYGSTRLPYLNTVDTARDMDRIRAALGDATMNYLGFSYGTELGAAYLHLFPTHMRVAVLDGAVDPLTSTITSFADQLKGFESAFDQFAAYCRVTAPCSYSTDIRTVAEDVLAHTRTSPLPVKNSSRTLTESLASTGILQALYSESTWPTLASALRAAHDGDGTGLLNLADEYNQRVDGRYTNLSDANTAISCNDSPPGPSDATIRATAEKWTTEFPLFGRTSAASLFSCQQWQPDRTVPPLPTARSTPRPVLVVGNLHDPATPYQGARDLTKTLGNARLLTWNGEGHTSYLQGSSCIDDAVNAYLISETLPKAGLVCPK